MDFAIMWFNNALIYNFELDDSINLIENLAEDKLKPCPPHAKFTYGWLPAFADELTYSITGCTLLCLGKEERILPRSVVQRAVEEKISQIEKERGYAVKKAEKGQITEDIEFDLLPKAFSVQKKLYALLDHSNNRLIINTSSANQATQLISLLRKSVPEISIEPITTDLNLALKFTSWIQDPSSLPKNFELAENCLLFSEDDEKKQFNCKGYQLPADEVHSLLDKGLVASEISLVWYDRIQFTLTQNLVLKRLKCLDYLVDEFHEASKNDADNTCIDAALTLLSQEHRGLQNDLLSILVKHDRMVQTEAPANI